MFKNYYEVRDWVEEFIPLVYGKEELGLARIRYFLKLLGNPEKKFKSIHVAGTSGKGSTAYYTVKLLQHVTRNKKHEAKIGLSISPHLVDIRERMQIFTGETKRQRDKEGLMPISRFLRLFGEIKPVVEKIQKEKPEFSPSYFEILVAAFFLYFAQEKVDWAVVEVGLGGRLDATNVLLPEVSVITNIGLDHTEILGKTIERIAFEKAGIIKKGVPVVTGCPSTSPRRTSFARGRSGSSAPLSSRGAYEVIAEEARKRKAPLITIDTQNARLANKLLALAAVKMLMVDRSSLAGEMRDELLAIDDKRFGSLPGRLEEIEPGVILDGAHNPQKIKFLINWLKEKTAVSITLVLAFKKGKDWKRMVDLLLEKLPVGKVIATQFYATTDMGRYQAVAPEEIAGRILGK